jgi:hypothetical protein
MAEPNDFSWSNPGAIVVKRVDAIAVYKDDDGNLVIRQQVPPGQQEDAVIIVPIDRAWTFIEALTREVKGQFPGLVP